METSLFQAIGMIDTFFQERGIKGTTEFVDSVDDIVEVSYWNAFNKFTFIYSMYDGLITARDDNDRDAYDGFWNEKSYFVAELFPLLISKFVKDGGWQAYTPKDVVLARPITEDDIKEYEDADPFSKPFELHKPFQLEVGDMLIKDLNYTMTPTDFKAKYR